MAIPAVTNFGKTWHVPAQTTWNTVKVRTSHYIVVASDQ